MYVALQEALLSIEDVQYVDLWNHNVEYIEQEESWARPAVFVEFGAIQWKAWQIGVEYRSEPLVRLHVVTDWVGSSSSDSEQMAESLKVFDLLDKIHKKLVGLEGETFAELDLVESQTCHDHEDILENIETYRCVGMRRLKG